MGNHQFYVPNPPQSGQIMTIVDSSYSSEQKFPVSIMGQGSKVKVLGSKNLISSRPNAPQITCSLVLLPNGQTEVIPTNNLV